MKNLVLVVLCAQLFACATGGGSAFYWGNYYSTLYKLKTSPSEETTLGHIEELEEIVTKSAEKQQAVPPGVHAELGYMYADVEQNDKAIEHYNAETEAYPEAGYFVQKLKELMGNSK